MLVMENGHGVLWAIMKVESTCNDDMNVILPLFINGELYLWIIIQLEMEGFSVLQILK